MSFEVTRTFRGPSVADRLAYIKGAAGKAMAKDVADEMGDQLRLNILRFGEPGTNSKWAQLSGFNANTQGKKHNIKEAKARVAKSYGARGAMRHLAAAQARAKMLRLKRAKAKAAGTQMSPHEGYAKRKSLGKTPGKGRHGAGVRLRDSDSMFNGMGGQIIWLNDGFKVRAVSKGVGPGRNIDNDRLFRIHAQGNRTLPKRNPAEDMTMFAKRAQSIRRAFLAGMTGAVKGGGR